jgi:hypothetical protein
LSFFIFSILSKFAKYAEFLNKMFERKWFKKVEFSRELFATSKGRQELYELLGVALQ